MSAQSGDWVRTHRHKHHGKVLTVYPDCPENELWKENQTGLSDEQMNGEWALLFVPAEATSIVVPVSDCEPAEEISLDELPDRIAIEAFGPTEEEAREIKASLESIEGGQVSRVGALWNNLGELIGLFEEGDTGDE